MKLNSFKSFVLKVYDSKGVADAFLRKYIILNELAEKIENVRLREGIKVRWEGLGEAAVVEVVFSLPRSVFSLLQTI